MERVVIRTGQVPGETGKRQRRLQAAYEMTITTGQRHVPADQQVVVERVRNRKGEAVIVTGLPAAAAAHRQHIPAHPVPVPFNRIVRLETRDVEPALFAVKRGSAVHYFERRENERPRRSKDSRRDRHNDE